MTLRPCSSVVNFPASFKEKEIVALQDKLYRCVLTIIMTFFPLVTERCSGSHAHEHGEHEHSEHSEHNEHSEHSEHEYEYNQ